MATDKMSNGDARPETADAEKSKSFDPGDDENLKKIIEAVKNMKVVIPHRDPECEFDKLITSLVVTKYDGEVFNGLFHGFGKADIRGGHYYEGELHEGFMHGKGIYIWCDGLKYEGDFALNAMTGVGKFSWLDGSIYEGDVVNGIRHGCGTFYHRETGIKYEGDWLQGKQHGKGRMTFCHEGLSFYEGEWREDKKCGWGERLYKSGNAYVGEWKDNLRHGQGTMKWIALGEKYSGSWKCGLQDGEGEHVWYVKRSRTSHYHRRNTYRGCFRDGKRNGWGVFHYANGSRYEGEWCNNLKSGKGKLIFRDGRIFEGDFVGDRIKSPSDNQDIVRTITPRTLDPSQDPLGFTLKLDHLLARKYFGSKEEEIQQVVNVVLRYAIFLRATYLFYARLGIGEGDCCDAPDDVVALRQIQLWRMMKDCRLQNLSKWSLTAYDRILTEGVIMEPMGGICPWREVLYEDFLTRLITISHHLFSEEFKCTYILSSCFNKLLLCNVLKYSCNIRGCFFHLPRRSCLVLKHVDPLFKTFQCLCSLLNKDESSHKDSITMRQFLLLMKDLRLIDDTLTTADVVEVLGFDDTKVAPTSTSYCLEHKMGFYDFLEALVGCSLLRKYPICVCNVSHKDLQECPLRNFEPDEVTDKEEGVSKEVKTDELKMTVSGKESPTKVLKGDDSSDVTENSDKQIEPAIVERKVMTKCIGCSEEGFEARFQRFVLHDFMHAVQRYAQN